MKLIKRALVITVVAAMLSLVIAPAMDAAFFGDSGKAYAATSYYKVWGKNISEDDYQKMAEKWPDYEPLRCNGWMTEVMNEVYKIPMRMGNWVIGTRTNFLNNSTVKPVKVVAGTYSYIKENVDLIKPGDIVFFNSSKKGNGVWTHVALIGEKHMLWHCTATSPGKKTGKYKSITSWMKKYRKEGEYGAYAEVWRVLSSFDVKSEVKLIKGKYKDKIRVARYKMGTDVTVKETLSYTADGPIMGKKIKITASLNKNVRRTIDGVPKIIKGRRIAKGEKLKGSTDLTFKIKKSGEIKIYYRFTVDEVIKKNTNLTAFTKIKYGKKVLKNYSKVRATYRTIGFHEVE